MATLIPRHPGPQVALRQTPNVRNTARVDMTPAIQAVQQVGGAIQEQLGAYVERAEDASLAEARAELSSWQAEQEDTRNPDSYLNFKGEQAFAGIDKAGAGLDQRIGQIRSRLPARTRERFDLMAGEFKAGVQRTFSRYGAAQAEAAVQAKQSSLVDGLVNEATLAGLQGDPDLAEVKIDELLVASARFGQQNGLPGETIAANAQAVRSAVYRQTAQGLLQRDADAASAYYERQRERMTAADRIAFESALIPVERTESAYAAGMAAVDGGVMPGAPLRATDEDAEAIQATYQDIASRHGFRVTSTVRTQAENDALQGSAKNSQHVSGTAIDLSVRDKTPEQIQAIVDEYKAAGFEVITATHGTGPHIHVELPPGRRAQTRTAHAGPAQSVAEALQRLRNNPNAGNRQWLRAAEATVRQEFAYRKAQQAEAERDVGLAIFNKMAAAPPNASPASLLSQDEMRFLALNPSVGEAINRWRNLTATGGVVKDDPVLVDNLRRLQANDPAAFAQYPLAEHAHQLSGATLLALTKEQREANKPGKAEQWASESEILRLAYADLGLTGQGNADKRGEFDLAFRREVRAFVEREKRQPTANETQVIVNKLKQPFARRTWWGGTQTRRLYEGPAEGFTVPATAREQIVAALQANGIPQPTEPQIVETYLSNEDASL